MLLGLGSVAVVPRARLASLFPRADGHLTPTPMAPIRSQDTIILILFLFLQKTQHTNHGYHESLIDPEFKKAYFIIHLVFSLWFQSNKELPKFGVFKMAPVLEIKSLSECNTSKGYYPTSLESNWTGPKTFQKENRLSPQNWKITSRNYK